MKYFGFTTFRDIDCTFYVDDESIELLPLKVDNNKLINKYFDEKDFYFEYNYWHNFINIAYVEKISHSMNGGIILKPKFTIENPHKEKITNIILSGLDIDYFFSPSSYFFYLKRNNTDISKDIIYNDLIADEWNIVFDDKAIKIELLYGNILNKGIASDLKLHPKIKISFSAINDYLFIYRLKAMIVKFLQVVLYRKRISSINTELWTTKENGNPSYVGKLLDHINKDNLDFKGYSEIKYVNYKEYISLFLDFVAKNIDLNIEHFPNESPRFTGYKYSQNLVVSIFSAFEFECRKNVELYEYIDDSQYKEIRKKTLNSIKEINCSSPEEEQFKKNAYDRIVQLGTQFGQKAKIINAYSKLSNVLANSLNSIFFLHKLENNNSLSYQEIESFAKYLADLRGKNAHGSSNFLISEKNTQIIRFLEIITYCQLLKRIGLNDKDVEMIIGEVFCCNNLMQSEKIFAK